MKSEFKARPVYLSNEDRIKAHFTTCFLALVIYRYLEKKLNSKYTVSEIIEKLRDMNFSIEKYDYIPKYRRTTLTDELHNVFKFRTDYKIISDKNFKKIINQTKNWKILLTFLEQKNSLIPYKQRLREFLYF